MAPETARRVLPKLAVVALVGATALAACRFAFQARAIWHSSPIDFGAFYRGAQAVSAGQTPYDIEGLRQAPFGPFYKFPPLFAIALAPLARLDFVQAWHVWFMISLSLYLAGFLLLAHAESMSARSARFWLLATAFLLFQPSLDTLYGGQLEFVLLLLFIVAYAALRQAPYRVALAGTSLALGVLLKLYPILAMPWLLFKRPGATLWLLVGLAALTLTSVVVAGWELQAEYVLQVLPNLSEGTAWLENQSYFGFLARRYVDGSQPPLSPVNLPLVTWLSRLAALLSYVVSLGVLARNRHAKHGFTVLLPCMLLAMPTAWIHYQTILLLPLGIYLAGIGRPSGRWAWPLLVVAFVLVAFGNEESVLSSRSGLIQSYKFYGVFLFWLLGLLWACHAGDGGRELTGEFWRRDRGPPAVGTLWPLRCLQRSTGGIRGP